MSLLLSTNTIWIRTWLSKRVQETRASSSSEVRERGKVGIHPVLAISTAQSSNNGELCSLSDQGDSDIKATIVSNSGTKELWEDKSVLVVVDSANEDRRAFGSDAFTINEGTDDIVFAVQFYNVRVGSGGNLKQKVNTHKV